jgi:spore coat polysaccharide biosynthesis predicted glycosyltransferase SpsG
MNNKLPVKILIRADADAIIGMGHLSRCRSLLISLHKYLPLSKTTIITQNKKHIYRFLDDSVDTHLIEIYSIKESFYIFKKTGFDIVIIDTPKIANEFFEYKTKILTVIDDKGIGLSQQDVLIQPNLGKSLTKRCGQYYLHGGKYVILHPYFSKYSKLKRIINNHVQNMVVCFGGSDQCQITLKIIPVLLKLEKNLQINIVLGHAFTNIDEVKKLIENDKRFNISIAVNDMAKILWKSDIAILSGGTMLYEACSLGTPSIIIPQNKAQDQEALLFHNQKAIINYGQIQNFSHKSIKDKIESIMQNFSLRNSLSTNARKIVSMDGADRIASNILNFLFKKNN